MKGLIRAGALWGVLLAAALWGGCTKTVQAAEETVKAGVHAQEIDLSGMTRSMAEQTIHDYVESLESVEITLIAVDDNRVTVTAGELGLHWANTNVLEEVMSIGTVGNVVERYRILKDLEYDTLVLPIEYGFDIMAIDGVLGRECTVYDRAAIAHSLKREKEQFQIVEGTSGYRLDVETSIDKVYDYLTTEWKGEEAELALHIVEEAPGGDMNELAKVQDVLGSFTTSFTSSGFSRTTNVNNGSRLISGVTLYPGEEFSMFKQVLPFTRENGYYPAGSYLNGKVVDSIGGGICQVSTTLYNAVLLAELEVTERHNHSMIVGYVNPSADAAIAESAGKDFRFVNNTEAPIYVESTVKNKHITVNIYGMETRSADRKVEYISEVLETIMPPADMIYQDPAQPIGYVLEGDSMHIGYKAKLWKVVTENGTEVSREQVNKSNYKMTPRSATIGVATPDPIAYNEMQAAIGTGSIDHVKNVIALLTGQAVTPENSGEIINEEPAQ